MLIKTCLVLQLLLFIPVTQQCFSSIGERAAKSLSDAAVTVSENLSKALVEAMQDGKEATEFAVKQLSQAVSDLGKRVSVKIDSGDLERMGNSATANLRDAIDELSQNWKLSLQTADMKIALGAWCYFIWDKMTNCYRKMCEIFGDYDVAYFETDLVGVRDFGAEAARHLSQAVQNINLHSNLTINVTIDANTARAIGYVSIAGGVAFSVLFVALLIGLRPCWKCCVFPVAMTCRSCCGRRRVTPSASSPPASAPPAITVTHVTAGEASSNGQIQIGQSQRQPLLQNMEHNYGYSNYGSV
ncbi:hypothetical protein Fcan01_11189 [Folsomia candida]|uniref:Uncharacterized protein n=1 Tax=Folsomia candida TaxID=158441 RepID=A0A226E8M8_FOLCA|nr:hypothetical protein Fcan01_11189 [Folsomia candida]